jgi:hypothetical protein
VAIEQDQRIREEVADLAVIHQRMQKEMNAMQAKMSDIRTSLRTFVTDYFSDLILQAEGLSMETYQTFFEREVGDKGIVLSTRLQNEFDRRLQTVSQALDKMQVGYNAEISHYNGTLTAMGKQGLDYVVKSNVINNATVLATRDGVVSLAKMVGLDLGKMLKFKPWGAVNLAKGLNGLLSVAGLALEAWDTYAQAKREKLFAESIQSMVANFRAQREELIEILNAPDYVDRFFAGYVVMHGELEGLERTLHHSKERQAQFAKWREQAEAIEAEFTHVNA